MGTVGSVAAMDSFRLLAVGMRCLPRVVARLEIELPSVPVSYQGRESRPLLFEYEDL